MHAEFDGTICEGFLKKVAQNSETQELRVYAEMSYSRSVNLE